MTIRKRVQTNCTGKSKTDQSMKDVCDINSIMKRYQKTGHLPHFPEKTPQFGDFSNVPTLMEAFDTTQKAKDMFYSLPSELRKEMDNNPSRLEAYISDPKHFTKLCDLGILKPVTTQNSANQSAESVTKPQGSASSTEEVKKEK